MLVVMSNHSNVQAVGRGKTPTEPYSVPLELLEARTCMSTLEIKVLYFTSIPESPPQVMVLPRDLTVILVERNVLIQP